MDRVAFNLLLSEMERQLGSKSRLAKRIKVTDRTLRAWQSQDPDRWHEPHGDNLDRVFREARKLGLNPAQFVSEGNIVLWDLRSSYEKRHQHHEDIPSEGSTGESAPRRARSSCRRSSTSA